VIGLVLKMEHEISGDMVRRRRGPSYVEAADAQ
jgi:hypothetical protein